MAGEHEFCWEKAVRRLGAEEKIPETLADKDLYTLSKAYVHALKKSSERKKYLVLSESLFLRLKEKGESRYIISVLADIYRQAWYDGETFGQYDRNDLARLAEKYYERLCDFQANEYELYEYARLVYRRASFYIHDGCPADRYSLKQKAFYLYEKVMERYEEKENGRGFLRPYVRACYGFCRCALDLYGPLSILQKECLLLGYEPHMGVKNREIRRSVYERLERVIETIKHYEELGKDFLPPEKMRNRRFIYEAPWDIYYMAGKIKEFALKSGISDCKEVVRECIDLYRYVCDLDRDRRIHGMSVTGFTHMYDALIDFYLYAGKEEELAAFIDEFKPYISERQRSLTTLRLHLKHGRADLFDKEWSSERCRQSGISKKRLEVLKLLRDLQDEKNLTIGLKKYNPFEQRVLYETVKKITASNDTVIEARKNIR